MIDEIREKVERNQVELSKHAIDQSGIRKIRVQEIKEAIASGQIIEKYPNDKYGPSCLVFGFTRDMRPIHIQCSYPSRPSIKVITLYEPDPQIWTNSFTERRQTENGK